MADLPETRITFVIASESRFIRDTIAHDLGFKKDILLLGEAGNGPELLDLLEQRVPDIVLMDIRMEGGFKVVPVIKSKYLSTKIIIHSILDDPMIIKKMLESGASSYLTMEYGIETIHEAMIACNKTGHYTPKPIPIPKKEEPDDFSANETRLLQLLAEGYTEDSLPAKMDLSIRTIHAIQDRLLRLTGIKTIAELLNYAVEKGVIKKSKAD